MGLGKVITTPIKAVWGPTQPISKGATMASYGGNLVNFLIKAPLKLVGRTVTIGIGVGALLVALKALAATSVGVTLGAAALMSSITAVPVVAGAILLASVIALGVLASIAIEKSATNSRKAVRDQLVKEFDTEFGDHPSQYDSDLEIVKNVNHNDI